MDNDVYCHWKSGLLSKPRLWDNNNGPNEEDSPPIILQAYNQKHPHSALGYLTPVEGEQQYLCAV